MNSLPQESVESASVNFNGLKIKKSFVPALVELIVSADGLKEPSDEILPEWRRNQLGMLLDGRIDEATTTDLISSLEDDEQGLQYLAGLMATRV